LKRHSLFSGLQPVESICGRISDRYGSKLLTVSRPVPFLPHRQRIYFMQQREQIPLSPVSKAVE